MNGIAIAKIIVSAATPFLVAVVGYLINKRLKKIEQLQWRNQRLTEKRLSVYDEIAPKLNILMCYFTYVGTWKEHTPKDIIEIKRSIDKVAHVNAPLFPEGFMVRYNKFMDICFQSFSGWGEDAKLRTHTKRRKQAAGSDWDPSWDHHFVDNDRCPDPKEVREAYNEVLSFLADSIELDLPNKSMPSGPVPGNYR